MRVVFFDIDGTLAIRTDIPQSAKEAVRRLRENGDRVFICSGRYKGYAVKHFGEYADGFICCNGRFAFIGDEIIVDEPLSKDTISDIISRIELTGISYVFYDRMSAYFKGTEEHYKEVIRVSELRTLATDFDPKSINVYNFDLFYDDRSVYEKAEERIKDMCICNPHDPHLSCDVTIAGMDKGDAVRRVLEYLEVPVSDSYAFGDGTNDISMLKAVGHGIAMGNARAELKETAEYITTDIDKDGVKNGLLHYGLI